MKEKEFFVLGIVLFLVMLVSGCGGGGGGESDVGDSDFNHTVAGLPGAASEYIILAWNDLGMHCLNPTYDQAVILPPYNTVWAQVIKRGNPPAAVTSNLTMEYRVVDNTTSANKRSYGQFWTYVDELFGVNLAVDTGLNLSDPNQHNGLAGTMVAAGDHFEVHGIPVTPVDDSGIWNPYQVIELTLKDTGGKVLAITRAALPTSDEINCGKCHRGNVDPFVDILEIHDNNEGSSLVGQAPVLCAECHGSPVLGNDIHDRGPAGKYLSEAMHGYHAGRGATCYDCHPGSLTRCNRSLAHTADDGNCITCHGDMTEVAGSITNNGRIPWVDEPECVDCQIGVVEVDTGATLYRYATGHGGIFCAGCHGSPHAMLPAGQASDNYQAIQYQGSPQTIGSCSVCHSSSRGRGPASSLKSTAQVAVTVPVMSVISASTATILPGGRISSSGIIAKERPGIYSSGIIYEIITETGISACVRRMGEEALDLSTENLELAKEEILAAIDHHLAERDFIEIDLAVREIVRGL